MSTEPTLPPVLTFDPPRMGVVSIDLATLVVSPDDGDTGSYTYAARLVGGALQVRGCPARVAATVENAPDDIAAWLAGEYSASADPAAVWKSKLAGTITVSGIQLKASIAARDAFVGQVVLLREAITAGLISPATSQSVWDANEAEHVLPASSIIALLVGYGLAWNAMFNEFAP